VIFLLIVIGVNFIYAFWPYAKKFLHYLRSNKVDKDRVVKIKATNAPQGEKIVEEVQREKGKRFESIMEEEKKSRSNHESDLIWSNRDEFY